MNKYNPHIHHRRSIRLKGCDYSQAGLYFITICCQDRICRFGHVENGEMILNDYGQIAYIKWTELPERFTNMELDVFQIMPNHIHGILLLNNLPVGATLAVAQNTIAQNTITQNSVAHNIPVAQNADAQNTITQNTITQNNVAQNIPVAQNADVVGATLAVAQNNVAQNVDIRAGTSPAPTVGDIVGAYKSLVANGCLDIFKSKNEIMGKLWQRNYYEHIIRNNNSYQTISDYIINNPSKWADDNFYIK